MFFFYFCLLPTPSLLPLLPDCVLAKPLRTYSRSTASKLRKRRWWWSDTRTTFETKRSRTSDPRRLNWRPSVWGWGHIPRKHFLLNFLITIYATFWPARKLRSALDPVMIPPLQRELVTQKELCILTSTDKTLPDSWLRVYCSLQIFFQVPMLPDKFLFQADIRVVRSSRLHSMCH